MDGTFFYFCSQGTRDLVFSVDRDTYYVLDGDLISFGASVATGNRFSTSGVVLSSFLHGHMTRGVASWGLVPVVVRSYGGVRGAVLVVWRS